jgi:anti-anti-sigma factor
MAGSSRRSMPPARPDAVTVTSATAHRDVRVVRHLRTGLVVRLTEAGGRTRAAVHGEVDLDCADLLEHVLTDALRSAPGGLHVDLGGVGFFDCAGLNSLLRIRALGRPGGGELTVTSVSAAVARVLDLTQTWGAFPSVADTRATAVLRPLRQAHPA